MATLTLSGTVQHVKSNTVGDQTLWVEISVSATTSAGDVIRLARLPHGAVVNEFVFIPGAAFVTDTIHKMGTDQNDALFLASDTYSTGTTLIHAPTGLGPSNKISVSDDAILRYVWVTWTPTSVITAGAVGKVRIRYAMDTPTAP